VWGTLLAFHALYTRSTTSVCVRLVSVPQLGAGGVVLTRSNSLNRADNNTVLKCVECLVGWSLRWCDGAGVRVPRVRVINWWSVWREDHLFAVRSVLSSVNDKFISCECPCRREEWRGDPRAMSHAGRYVTGVLFKNGAIGGVRILLVRFSSSERARTPRYNYK
jgi:hypothetical protein